MNRVAATLLPEWDHETATTRRVLERLPEDRLDWQPHPRSWTVRQLASHLANVPSWMEPTLTRDELDLAPPGQPAYSAVPAASRAELLERFDANVTQARATLAEASDERMLAPWSLLSGGKPILSMPRAAVLRGFIFSHMIHHRAQLGVYLRLLDGPVPAIYGPSADDKGM
jgi:uncharacterized protein (TIGR03083 family)